MSEECPCSVCGEPFTPSPRAGKRQKTCSRPDCQKERHRLNCVDWHRRHPDYDRKRRLADRVERETTRARPTQGRLLHQDPISQLAWETLRDLVPLELRVVLEELLKSVIQWARDLVDQETQELRDKLALVGKRGPRDALARGSPPP